LYELEGVKRVQLKLRSELAEAAKDFFYLLNRGYSRRSSLDLVSSRYRLSKLERMVLYRGVFSADVSRSRALKALGPGEVYRKVLIVDGFNVASTVQSSLLRDTVVLGTDGVVRDLAAGVRKIRVTPLLVSSFTIVLEYLARLSPSYVTVILDSQVSKSGELAATLRKIIGGLGLCGDVFLTPRADKQASILKGVVVASSDSVILDRVSAFFDLGGWIARIICPESLLDLTKVIGELHA